MSLYSFLFYSVLYKPLLGCSDFSRFSQYKSLKDWFLCPFDMQSFHEYFLAVLLFMYFCTAIESAISRVLTPLSGECSA